LFKVKKNFVEFSGVFPTGGKLGLRDNANFTGCGATKRLIKIGCLNYHIMKIMPLPPQSGGSTISAVVCQIDLASYFNVQHLNNLSNLLGFRAHRICGGGRGLQFFTNIQNSHRPFLASFPNSYSATA